MADTINGVAVVYVEVAGPLDEKTARRADSLNTEEETPERAEEESLVARLGSDHRVMRANFNA